MGKSEQGKVSPCKWCFRVPDRFQCENKGCGVWRQWYINRWEYVRSLYGVKKEDTQ